MFQTRQPKQAFEKMRKNLLIQNVVNLFDGVFEMGRTLGISSLPDYVHVFPIGDSSMCHRCTNTSVDVTDVSR